MVVDSAEPFQLREPGVSYHIDFGSENDDIGVENGYFCEPWSDQDKIGGGRRRAIWVIRLRRH